MNGIWLFILHIPLVVDNQILNLGDEEFVPFSDSLLEYGDYSDYTLVGDCDGQNCSNCCDYDYIVSDSDVAEDGR